MGNDRLELLMPAAEKTRDTPVVYRLLRRMRELSDKQTLYTLATLERSEQRLLECLACRLSPDLHLLDHP
jgi:hypothetical protein